MRHSTRDDAVSQEILPVLKGCEGEFDVAGIFEENFAWRVDKDPEGNELLGTAGFERIRPPEYLVERLGQHRLTAYHRPHEPLLMTTPAAAAAGYLPKQLGATAPSSDITEATERPLRAAGYKIAGEWSHDPATGYFTASLQPDPTSERAAEVKQMLALTYGTIQKPARHASIHRLALSAGVPTAQADAVVELLTRLENLTQDEAQRLGAAGWVEARQPDMTAFDATRNACTAAARAAGRGVALEAVRNAAWDAARKAPFEARATAAWAARGLVVRDLVSAEQYQSVTRVSAGVLGPLHPDDLHGDREKVTTSASLSKTSPQRTPHDRTAAAARPTNGDRRHDGFGR